MAVKLRLKRIGRRKRPFYRIVAIDSRSRRDGSEIERLGWYDPLRTDVAIELHEDRIIHWLKQGAQPSETVNNILKEMGLKYKIPLMEEGKSEEQIATLLTEWKMKQEEKRNKQIEKKKALMAEVDKVKKETSDLITRWPDIREETAPEEIKQVEEEVNATRTLLEKIIRIENEDRGMFETEKNARSASIKDLQNRKKLRQMYGGKEGGDSRFLDDKK